MAESEKNNQLFSQYINILNEYLLSFSKSTTCSKLGNDRQYLLINGLNTLTHIFNIVLQQTANYNLALERMQQGIDYYIPFIEQMKENILQDLNISSNSASIFVYKKTIGDMRLSLNQTINEEQRDLLYKIQNFITNETQFKQLLCKNIN